MLHGSKRRVVAKQGAPIAVFERLEDRTLLAGDITAALTGSGDLVITGDPDDNQIQIEQFGGSVEVSGVGYVEIEIVELTVTGLGGTSINGGPADGSETFLVSGRVEINPKAGGDTVIVGGTLPGPGGITHIPGNLIINTLRGEDIVDVYDTWVHGNARIFTGRDGDEVDLRYVGISGNLLLDTDGGDDGVHTYNLLVAGNTAIDTGQGVDFVFVDSGGTGTTWFGGTFDLNTGSSEDLFVVGFFSDTSFDIATFNGEASIKMGSGNDLVDIFAADFNSDLTIRLGAGRHCLMIFDTDVLGALNIHGVIDCPLT